MKTRHRYVIVAALCAMCLAPFSVVATDVIFLYEGAAGTAVFSGLQQGLSEANAQGEFLGIEYRLVTAEEAAAYSLEPIAVIVASNATRVSTVAENYSDRAVINVSNTDNALREQCIANLFHIAPSEAMLADAERQWQRKTPGSPAVARAWHKTFRKYAASQLNIRYREQFERDMDDDAWAGWATTKLLADTIARQPNLTAAELLELLKTNLAFDGQKGSDMSFRETGQLRQPILLVDGEKIVGEAPVRGVVSTTNLDSLGIASCPK